MEILIVIAAVLIGGMVHAALELIFKLARPRTVQAVEDTRTNSRYDSLISDRNAPEFNPT